MELSAHGGRVVLKKILRLCCENGARLAEPGEFTKRAFLNGKMDLTEAEAVMDIIGAKARMPPRLPFFARDGALFKGAFRNQGRNSFAFGVAFGLGRFPRGGHPEVENEALLSRISLAKGGFKSLLTPLTEAKSSKAASTR